MDGRGPRSFRLPRAEGLPPSLPCLLFLLSLLLLEIPLKKWSMVFCQKRHVSDRGQEGPRVGPARLPACRHGSQSPAAGRCRGQPAPAGLQTSSACSASGPPPGSTREATSVSPGHTETSLVPLPRPASRSTHVTRPVTRCCAEPKTRSRGTPGLPRSGWLEAVALLAPSPRSQAWNFRGAGGSWRSLQGPLWCLGLMWHQGCLICRREDAQCGHCRGRE